MVRTYLPWLTGYALLIMAFLSTLVLLECVLYFRRTPWYFRLGPTLHREQWQTSVSASEAHEAIARALPQSDLSTRDSGTFAAFRRPWWVLSAYPRATLRAEPGADHAVLIYEVKPFLTMAPFAVYMLMVALGGFLPHIGFASFAFIVVVYVALWRHELKKLNRLHSLRVALRPIGVRICENCGYDLFVHVGATRCPECGVSNAEHPAA